jgi:uncharacterized SAM-binding protein YcdF (DUF218 family)
MVSPPKPRKRLPIGRFFGFGVIGVWLLSVIAVVFWGTRNGEVPSDAIIVLGAAQYAGRPSPVLKARLDHAVTLWKRGLARWLILTGGTGAGDTTSEAAVSRRYVMRQGVPDSVILLENNGRNTNASLASVANIMSIRKLDRAILVSDPFHMLRLQILAREYGLHCVTSPTRTSPISASPTEALGYVLSESVKVPVTLALAAVEKLP